MATQADTRDEATETSSARTSWYAMPVEDVLEELGADECGLSTDEARERSRRHGPNRIREQEEAGPWQVLLRQFADPLIHVLLAALVATVAIRSWSDAIVIAAVLVVNGTVGFFQEYRAESAVQSLMDVVSPRARVMRGGRQRMVDAEELVPGDIVELTAGEVVPADVRLLSTEAIRVDESPLTGESVPVDKTSEPVDGEGLPPADRESMVFMGTAVTSGSARGVVVETGPSTEIGQIAEQVEQTRGTESPLRTRIDRLARLIAVAILAIAALAAAGGLLQGRGVVDTLLLAVALAVAAIPAGLPVVVTVALAVGVRRMAARDAVIRRLEAVDTLGACSVIMSDKTGTLTRGQMVVRTVVAAGQRFEVASGDDDQDVVTSEGRTADPGEHPVLREVLTAGVLCNDVAVPEADDDAAEQGARQDPMELALVEAATAGGMRPQRIRQRHPRRATTPFRTEQRYMATVHEDPDGDPPLVVVKGAPERVVEMCERRRTADGGDEALDAQDVVSASEELARDGHRVLAVAVARGEGAARPAASSGEPEGLTFVGLFGLLDPPRESAVTAVEQCHQAGIRVLMITGDHASTAVAVATQVGIGSRGEGTPTVVTGQELAGLDDEGFARAVRDVDVFARVAPEQKLRLVQHLKDRDRIVAVTGDGVNDAPALQSGHIGAAMGSGTEVAQEASDMVITDDDFASVYAAVEEGRTAFRNIRMATFFLLSTGFADVLIILSALALGWPLPLLPAQILWVNVVTNGIADVALAFEPGDPSLFRRRPRPSSEGVLNRNVRERLVVVGVWLALGTLGMFWWSWGVQGDDLGLARTIAVTSLVLFQKVHVLNCRSEEVSVFRTPLLSNRVLLVGVLTSLAVHVAAMYWSVTQQLLGFEPLGAQAWLMCIGVAATAIVPNELHKRYRRTSERA